MEKELVLCQCKSLEHQIVFVWFEDDDDSEVYMQIHLIKTSFWRRLVNGIKYIFGYKSRFGAWDEIVLDNDNLEQFKKVIQKLEK